MNIKVISRNVGLALLVSALFMFLSVLVSVANGNDSALAALSISFTITFIVGVFPFIFVKRSPHISLKDGYMIVFLSWILSFIFGMLPYLLWGGPFTAMNAWFESVSGFTTTGATILENVEVLPQSLLFWRASTHFIGGLGVTVFLLIVIPHSGPVKLRLSNMELSSLSKEGYNARTNRTIYIFAYVYLALNAICFLLFWLSGMSAFDAICHAFSVCSTGGFSTRTESIGAFNSVPIDIITIFFMYLSSLHFGLLYMSVVTRSLKPLNNPVLKFYTNALILASIAATLSLKISGVEPSWGRAVLNGTFHIVSFGSTTGLTIGDVGQWSLFGTFLLIAIGLQCGMAGSTTGGLKSDRVYMLFKSVVCQVKSSLYPNIVTEVRVGNRVLHKEEIYPHILYVAMYIFLLFVCPLLALNVNPSDNDAICGSLSSLSNIGQSVGNLGSLGHYNFQPSAAKLIFTIEMVFGRLEIYPVLAFFGIIFGPRRK